MKARHVLYLVAVLGLLAPIGASPVLAGDGDAPIWVHQIMVTYTGRSPRGPDAIVALVHIRDDDLNKIVGATVRARWTLPDGSVYLQEGVETNTQGIAEFSIFEGAGDYTVCVTDVAKAGFVYTPESNWVTCATFILPPYKP